MRKRNWIAWALLLGVACSSGAIDSPPAETTWVYLVRHAEKAAAEDDPELTPEGAARADALAQIAADAGVERVLSTPFKRTLATAQPAASKLGIEIEELSIASGLDAHIEAMATMVESDSRAVFLVVGHSNTIPLLIGRLGGPTFVLNESEYGDLFVMEFADGAVEFERRRFGD